jgi:outer membrane protein assembly factor BamB
LALPGGRIFLSGGYNAGSMMLQLTNISGRIVPRILFKLPAEVFGATQHTPVFHNGHIFGTRPNGQFVCLNLDGKIAWATPPGKDFGLGPFMPVDGGFLVMNDSGTLTLLDASPSACAQLAEAKVLTGRESWAPMVLADGRLFVRDLTRLVCLGVAPNDIAEIR